jgi:hypothetical protein
MDQHRRGRRIKTLWALVLLGAGYSTLLYSRRTLTGRHNVDGILSMLLGLYICSHPAANLVDILFFSRGSRDQFSSRRSFFLWLTLNVVVFVVGWMVIFLGTTHLVGKGD